MKNPNLCERQYCRNPWTHQVNVYQGHWETSWTLWLCEEHVQPYLGQTETNVHKREEIEGKN